MIDQPTLERCLIHDHDALAYSAKAVSKSVGGATTLVRLVATGARRAAAAASAGLTGAGDTAAGWAAAAAGVAGCAGMVSCLYRLIKSTTSAAVPDLITCSYAVRKYAGCLDAQEVNCPDTVS